VRVKVLVSVIAFKLLKYIPEGVEIDPLTVIKYVKGVTAYSKVKEGTGLVKKVISPLEKLVGCTE
jgi:hypothetical protein